MRHRDDDSLFVVLVDEHAATCGRTRLLKRKLTTRDNGWVRPGIRAPAAILRHRHRSCPCRCGANRA